MSDPRHQKSEPDLTPTELALARVLRAWNEWPGDGGGAEAGLMTDVGDLLVQHGLAWNTGPLTTKGEELLRRLDAEEIGF